MLTLIPRQKWHDKKRNVCVGDVVILIDELTRGACWLLGRVLKGYPDKHGLVLSVLVKTQNAELKRPVSKLCVIEAKGF